MESAPGAEVPRSDSKGIRAVSERRLLRVAFRCIGLTALCWYLPHLSHDVAVLWRSLRFPPVTIPLRAVLEERIIELLPNVVGALLGLYLLLGGRALLDRLAPAGSSRCPECGYDLTGAGHARRCPECGSPVPPELRSAVENSS